MEPLSVYYLDSIIHGIIMVQYETTTETLVT